MLSEQGFQGLLVISRPGITETVVIDFLPQAASASFIYLHRLSHVMGVDEAQDSHINTKYKSEVQGSHIYFAGFCVQSELICQNCMMN